MSNNNSISKKKSLSKIYLQLDKMASKGILNHLEYYKYIDDCVKNGNYDNLLQCLYVYYNINTDKITFSLDVRQYWTDIIAETLDPLAKKMKKLYTNKKVYQQSYYIYNDVDNNILGTITEIEAYTQESKYYLKNKEYAKITKTLKINLEAVRKSDGAKLVLDTYDYNTSDDVNIYNKYAQAISFLLK